MDRNSSPPLLLLAVRVGAAAGLAGLCSCAAVAGAATSATVGGAITVGAALSGLAPLYAFILGFLGWFGADAAGGIVNNSLGGGDRGGPGVPGLDGLSPFGGFAQDIGNLILGGAVLLLVAWVAYTYLTSRKRHCESRDNRAWLTRAVNSIKEKIDDKQMD